MSIDITQDREVSTLRRPRRMRTARRSGDTRSRFSYRTIGRAGLLLSLVVAAFCVWKGSQVAQSSTRPIETIRVGERVIVDAPKEALATDAARLSGLAIDWDQSSGSLEIEGVADPLRELADASIPQIDRAEYRLIRLRAYDVWADGTLDQINVETLQPWQWIQEHEAHVGADAPLPLDAFEMGLPEGMTGTVDDILPCPEFREGHGRIVLTTINHLNRDIIELTLEGESSRRESLRPTGTHKFYSVSSGQWLSASELQPGETLNGVEGKVRVVSRRKIPGTHRVYNFTVQGEHLYRVANCGVLVHNNGCSMAPKGGPHGQTKLPWGDGLESHHMPAKSVNGLHPDVGAAIQMERVDHLLTSSHGSRSGSAAYRSHIEDLLNQGKVREAMAIEIRDVRRAAIEGSGDIRKYNSAMREMLEYARGISYVP